MDRTPIFSKPRASLPNHLEPKKKGTCLHTNPASQSLHSVLQKSRAQTQRLTEHMWPGATLNRAAIAAIYLADESEPVSRGSMRERY